MSVRRKQPPPIAPLCDNLVLPPHQRAPIRELYRTGLLLYNRCMNDPEITKTTPKLNQALKMGFRAAYDSLGYVVFSSFALFFVCSVLFAAVLLVSRVAGTFGLLLVVPGLFVGWMGMVGIFYYVRKVIYHQRPTPADTLIGMRVLLGPALALFVVDIIAGVLLVGDVVFFALAFQSKGGVVYAALAILFAYMGLMWLLMGLYHAPLLVDQLEHDSGPRLKKILYKSFLLTADNPAFTVGLFVVIIALTILCAMPALMGVALLLPAVAAFLLTFSLRELYIKYGIVEPEPEVIEDKPWTLGGQSRD